MGLQNRILLASSNNRQTFYIDVSSAPRSIQDAH